MNKPSTSIVIPTLSGEPRTLNSVPDGVETVVVDQGNRAEARNIGAQRTTGDVIVFCDDDIAFTESFFWNWVTETNEGTVAGLRDFDFGLLLTRFLVVYRADFERLGGFDERLNHMEDTEFSLKTISHGLEIVTIPRADVHHEPHESAGQTQLARLLNTVYLSRRYPRYAARLWLGQFVSRASFIPDGEQSES